MPDVSRRLLLASLPALAIGGLPACVQAQGEADQGGEATYRGTLYTGMMAIGGETTGTILAGDGMSWELDLGGTPEARRFANAHSGKTVVVTGTLERRPGVEVAERFIIRVRDIRVSDSGKQLAIK